MKRFLNILIIGIFMIIPHTKIFATGDESMSSANTKTSISGKVVDIKTGESLSGVAILIEKTNIKVYSDLDGEFVINEITPGDYNIVLSLISYKKSLIENIKINSNSKENIIIKLDAIK